MFGVRSRNRPENFQITVVSAIRQFPTGSRETRCNNSHRYISGHALIRNRTKDDFCIFMSRFSDKCRSFINLVKTKIIATSNINNDSLKLFWQECLLIGKIIYN